MNFNCINLLLYSPITEGVGSTSYPHSLSEVKGNGLWKLQTFLESLHWSCCNILLLMFWCFGREARRILAPWSGIEPTPPALEGEVLTTGPPGKFPKPALSLILGFSLQSPSGYWEAGRNWDNPTLLPHAASYVVISILCVFSSSFWLPASSWVLLR